MKVRTDRSMLAFECAQHELLEFEAATASTPGRRTRLQTAADGHFARAAMPGRAMIRWWRGSRHPRRCGHAKARLGHFGAMRVRRRRSRRINRRGESETITLYFSDLWRMTPCGAAPRGCEIGCDPRLMGSDGRTVTWMIANWSSDARGRRTRVHDVLRHYFPRVYRFALPRVDRNAEAAKDVVQATLIKAMRGIGGLARRGGAVHVAVPDLPAADRRPRARANGATPRRWF